MLKSAAQKPELAKSLVDTRFGQEAGVLTIGGHRVDASEVWHHYAGAPLALTVSENGHDAWSIRLGTNLMAGERPQAVVPPHAWQTAESLGRWTLVGCTVAPAFEFLGFELAPEGWRPEPRRGGSQPPTARKPT